MRSSPIGGACLSGSAGCDNGIASYTETLRKGGVAIDEPGVFRIGERVGGHIGEMRLDEV